jgi:hypothetical protein
MTRYRITYRETVTRYVVVDAENRSAASQVWIDYGPDADEDDGPVTLIGSEVEHHVISIEPDR